MSLKAKITAMFLLVGIIPLVLVAVISFVMGSRNIESEVFAGLSMYAAITDEQLENYFGELAGDGRVLATTRDVYQSMNILQGGEHQGQTIGFVGDVEDPMWLDRVSMLDTLLPRVVAEYGLALIFVTDPYGVVVYDTLGRIEGTNLAARDYMRGSLAGRATWSELFYSDVVNTICMVISTPVLREGESGAVVGTLNLVLYEDYISALVHDGLDTLGETADAYLIDANGLLLTDTLRGQFRSRAALNERISTEAVQMLSGAIRAGDLGFQQAGVYRDCLGAEVLGQVEVTILGDRAVGLVVEIDAAEAFAGVRGLRNTMLVIGLVAALIVAFVGVFIAGGLAAPMQHMAKVAAQFAEGDLTAQATVNRTDEIGQLAQAFNAMGENLRGLVGRVVEAVESTSSSAAEVSSAVEETAASVEEVASTANEFASTVETTSTNSQNMADLASSTMDKTNRGAAEIEEAVVTMEQINSQVSALSKQVTGLNTQSDQIRTIVDLITSIADQTNLLALNAAIEAARAGEHGRGFAVVAEEVRKLAEQSAKAAGEITEVIGEMQNVVQETVEQSQQSAQRVVEGTSHVQTTGKTFAEIQEVIEQLTEGIQSIAAANEQLASGSEEIAASSEEQSASVEQVGASIENVANVANELRELVQRFTV